MNLTKGKIKKLYNKKKQTCKRFKYYKKHIAKIKTIKHKTHINLANKSLKNLYTYTEEINHHAEEINHHSEEINHHAEDNNNNSHVNKSDKDYIRVEII